MTQTVDRSVAQIADRMAPLLDPAVATAAEAALRLASELTGAQGAGLVLLRNGRALAETWVGGQGAPRDAMRAAALALAATPPTPPRRSDVHAQILDTLDNLSMAFALAWKPGVAPDLPDGALVRAETIARVVAGRWVRTRALEETRAARAQQERWFHTMDQQLRVLDRERQKFVAVVSQSDTFMFVVDPKLEITWVNRAVSRHCESEAHSAGAPISNLDQAWNCLSIAAAPAGSSSCPVTRAIRSNTVVHEELRRTQGDDVQHVYLTFLPIQGTDGQVAEVLVMIQDLSGLDVVRRMEARYRRLFEHSPDGMLMIDPAGGRILLANEAAVELTGYDRRALLRMDAEALHGAEWSAVQELCRKAVAATRSFQMGGRMTSASGWPITVSLTAVHFDLDDRAVALVQYRDITERKRLETELRHSHKMEAVGTLAGGVAHDFNNLLTVILGKSELLAGHLAGQPELRLLAETIQKSARRGSLLTRRLLSFSRKDIVRAERLDLVSVVREFLPLFDTLLAERALLDTQLPDEPCMVRADRGEIEQVLMNLAVNGRDAMPDGGCLHITVRTESGDVASVRGEGAPEPTVEVASEGSGRRVVLEVRDEGVGIDETTRSHIFEPFFTTKALGEGTGLGLSTVYAIVRECEGRIDVVSAPGQGSTFRVFLPCATPVDGGAHEAHPPEQVASPGSERVLLVEDEDDLRDMAREALELGGYSVVCAACGEDAIALHEQATDSFQLLLTDVVMPGISGGELAERIRAVDPTIRVLYMSGYNDDAIVRYGVSRDEASFLPKPFTLAQLAGKVRELLDARVA